MKAWRASLIAAGIFGSASCALAQSAPASGLALAFENTIVSTYPDGRQAELWLNSDGTYIGEGRRHKRSSGQWEIRGDQICMKQRHPIAFPFTYCTAMHDGGIGTTWTARATTGERVTVELVAGRPHDVAQVTN